MGDTVTPRYRPTKPENLVEVHISLMSILVVLTSILLLLSGENKG